MRILLLLLLCLPGVLHAQNPLTDSLLVELSRAETDSAKVLLHCNLSRQYGLTDAIKSKEHGLTAVQMAQSIGFKQGETKAHLLIGNAYLMMGEYDDALKQYFQSLKLSEQTQDTSNLLASYINLGNIYSKTKDLSRAVQYYKQAAALAAIAKDQQRLSSAYNNIGDVLENQQNYKEARRYYLKAIELQEQTGHKKGLAVSLHNLGYLHLRLGNPANGLPYLFKSVELSKEVGNDMIRMSTLGKISELYLVLGQPDKALEYASQGFEMAMKTTSSKKIAEASQNMHAAYAALKDYNHAYDYLQQYTAHSEVLNTESRKKIETEVTVKYETEQKDLENKRLKEEQARQKAELTWQRWLLAIGVCVMVVLLVLLVELYRSRLRQKEAFVKLTEAHVLTRMQQSEIALQSELLLEQNTRLEKQSDFQRKVFSIISHDLRGPFGSVKSVLGMALRKTMSESDMTRIFTLLSRDMDVATNMLDNVLIWAKSQIADSSVSRQAVGLQLLTDQTFAQVKHHADNKGIALHNFCPESAYALADKERLSFVIRNLLMNAIKFSQPGGKILLQAKEQGEHMVVSVIDYGRGISSANIGKLFSERRFTTLGTAGEKGTGLGLMLCKELLESFDGCIWVESTEGAGSVFYVELPAAAIPADQTAIDATEMEAV